MKRIAHLLTAETTEQITAPTANVFVGRLLSILSTFGFYAGLVFIGIAIFHLVMRFRENEPERIHQVVLFGLAGIALTSLGTIFGFFFAGTGLEEYLRYAIIF